MRSIPRRPSALLPLLLVLQLPVTAQDDLSRIEGVPAQALAAAARRVESALELAGARLPADASAALAAALAQAGDEDLVDGVQATLDPLCLAEVHINPEGRVKVRPGPAPAVLVQNGWTVHLVKVHNEAGVTAPLRLRSPNAAPVVAPSSYQPRAVTTISAAEVRDRWLDVSVLDDRPLSATLSGLVLEYRPIALYSRDAGQREARLSFDAGHGSQDLGFRADLDVLFRCEPAVPVVLRVRDVDGSPTTAHFVVTDDHGRVYPARWRRLEPDFFFQDQVYRADGEALHLPPGEYDVRYGRGPEYLERLRRITVTAEDPREETFQLERWVHLAKEGWYSGDHHVHAAGCAHYEAPTEGVGPATMIRHILGEDLNVGCVLAWGPCWFAQKEYFDGKDHPLSRRSHLMRYDVEISGFASSHAGHLCLLRLTEDDYPGTSHPNDWPSWNLPVLQWAKEQGAVVGYSHSGWGLEVAATHPLTYELPPFDGIGANEYVVDAVHGAVDFISMVDTPAPWELNVWYHVLNCGYETRISGETDFPCIYGERVGLGRSYVRLESGTLTFDSWIEGIRDGAAYVSDGLSHLVDFAVGDLEVGATGAVGRPSVLATSAGKELRVSARVAAWLSPTPAGALDIDGHRDVFVYDDLEALDAAILEGPEVVAALERKQIQWLLDGARGRAAADGRPIRERSLRDRPYWHVERARVEDSRRVPVELIVNGEVAAVREVEADGSWSSVSFDWTPERSSWVCLRIYPSSHTNPIFVEVDGAPIRANPRSARWCADAVEQCWKNKRDATRESEREAARAAYDVARKAYERIELEARGR